MGGQDSALLMGHGENAVPARWRFVKKIFLTTLPVGACRAVAGPLVKNGLERGLGVQPAALLEERASLVKTIEAGLRVGRKIGCGGDQFIDDDRLQFAFHADEIQFAKNEARVFCCEVGGFVDENVGSVVFIQALNGRSKIDGIANGGEAEAQRKAHTSKPCKAEIEAIQT